MKICNICGMNIDDNDIKCPYCKTIQQNVGITAAQPKQMKKTPFWRIEFGPSLSKLLKVIIVGGCIIGFFKFVYPIINKSENYTPSRTANQPTSSYSQTEKQQPSSQKKNAADYFETLKVTVYEQYGNNSTFIEKVKGLADKTVKKTIYVKDKSGNVCGKASDEITLTAGKENYFKFRLSGIPEDAEFYGTVTEESEWSTGERNAVEMVKSNRNDKHLYITFRQVGRSVGVFSKFKILFYKGDEIVWEDDKYFSSATANMKHYGDEDVADVYISEDYDRFEVFIEP